MSGRLKALLNRMFPLALGPKPQPVVTMDGLRPKYGICGGMLWTDPANLTWRCEKGCVTERVT